MQAYISNRDERERHYGLDRVTYHRQIGAVGEALSLLADVESGSSAGYVPLDGLGEVWTYPPVDGNAHAALYEALLAFVNDGGR